MTISNFVIKLKMPNWISWNSEVQTELKRCLVSGTEITSMAKCSNMRMSFKTKKELPLCENSVFFVLEKCIIFWVFYLATARYLLYYVGWYFSYEIKRLNHTIKQYAHNVWCHHGYLLSIYHHIFVSPFLVLVFHHMITLKENA